jgi:hypothetical protein
MSLKIERMAGKNERQRPAKIQSPGEMDNSIVESEIAC